MEQNKAFVQAIIDRMKTVLGVTRDKDVAVHFEGARGAVSVWKIRGTIPFAECLALALKYDVSLDWLILGRGPMAAGTVRREDGMVAPAPSHFCDVPTFDAIAFKELEPKEWWALPRQWLEQEGVNVTDAIVVRAAGDSMGGTIEDGQLVLVDRRPRDTDGVYLVRIAGVVRFKRVQYMVDGSLRLSSDNPAYAVDTIPASDRDKVEIIGYCHATVQRLR